MNNNEQNNLGNSLENVMPNPVPDASATDQMTTATVDAPVTPEQAPVMPDVMGMPEGSSAPAVDVAAPGVVSAEATAPEVAPVSDAATTPMPDASIAPGVTMPAEGAANPENGGLVLDPSIAAAGTIEPYKEPEPEAPKKKVKLPLLITLLVVLVIALAVAGFAAYIFLLVKPEKIHSKVITEFFNNANTYVTSSMKEQEKYETLMQKGKLSFETNFEEFEILNNYAIDYTLGVDPSKNLMAMDLDLLEKNNSILDGKIYMLKDGIYFDGKKIYDGVLKIGEATFDFADLYNTENTLSKDDVSYLITAYKNALIKSLDESKYQRKLTTEKINNKNQKVFNNSYIINESTMLAMSKSILESLKADSKVLELMAKATATDVATITAGMDSAIKDLTDPEVSGSTEVYSFNVYTSIVTNKVLAVKLLNGASTIFEYYEDNGTKNYTLSLEGLDIVATKKANTTTIKMVYDHEPIADITIVKQNGNSSTITFNLTAQALLTQMGLDVESIRLTITSETKDKEATAKVTLSLVMGEESYDLSVSNKATTSYNEKVDSIDVSGAVNYEEVPEETIMTNVLKALENTDLYAIISGTGELPSEPQEPEDPTTPTTPTTPTEPEEPTTPPKEYDPNCASAYSCRDCTDTECTCTYSTGSFSTFEEHDITCPKK